MAPRTDAASRIIKATPQRIYEAFLDGQAVASWRPPKGMTAEVFAFEPREGGVFRMSFTYADAAHAVPGKTSEHADVFRGRFVELVPGRRIVEEVEFEADDPAFAGAMRIVTTLTAVPDGTEVAFRCENVPDGIRPEDHQAGMASTLANLAAFTE
ncbi:SRPBCC family protein [Labrys monachus]|uniref:Uncharacterized protein YndB with AHSA1/START domain n=1 Tax=Labrys monachus TaxID=217067 RepID=A0ABU0FAL5_9HYPH|nr:SRPBCC family protein [Labrys monachus]MDQ0391660.1 uncharacterized protein YndB with AHSA1/START domain [Labrys monachus]